MAILGMNVNFEVDTPTYSYGYTSQPSWTEFVRASDLFYQTSAGNQGTRIIPQTGVVALQSIPVYADMDPSQFFYDPSSSGNWTTCTDPKTGNQLLYYPDSNGNNSWAKTQVGLPSNGSFYCVINRGQPPGGTDPNDLGNTFYTILEVGTDAEPPNYTTDTGGDSIIDYSAGCPFRLIFQTGQPIALQQAYFDTGLLAWTYPDNLQYAQVASDAGLMSDQLLERLNRTFFIEWLPMPDQNLLFVSIQGIDRPLIWQGSQVAGAPPLTVAAGRISVTFSQGVMSFGLYSMQFSPSGTITSSVINVPYGAPSTAQVGFSGGSQPDGTSLDYSYSSQYDPTGVGGNIQFELALSGSAQDTGLAYSTPAFSGVYYYIPGVYNYNNVSEYSNLTAALSDYEEEIWFDESTMTIRTQLGCNFINSVPIGGVFSNNPDIDGYFTGAGSGKHMSCRLTRDLVVNGNDIYWGLPASETTPGMVSFSGYCNFQSNLLRGDPVRKFDMVCKDGLFLEESVPIGKGGSGIFYDGWCFFSALCHISQTAGRHPDFIGDEFFSCSFGENPTQGDGTPCSHYKLPVGTGQSPAMGFNPDMSCLDCLSEIARMVNGVIYVDAFNVLHIIDYYNTIYDPWNYAGNFTTMNNNSWYCSEGYSNPGDMVGLAPYGYQLSGDVNSLNQMWDQTKMSVDTSNRRNTILLGSIDVGNGVPFYNLKTADDFYDMPGISLEMDGFYRPYVDISKRFSDPTFTEWYSQWLMWRLFRPTITMQTRSCYQMYGYPLMNYSITESPYLIDGTLYLTCERIVSRWSSTDPTMLGSEITGRLISNE